MKVRAPTSESLATGSLNRAVILLRAIAQGSSRGSSLTEIVARTALPRPTIHRVLDQLIEVGWVVRDRVNARFNLGTDLAALGYSAISRTPIDRIASSHLIRLAQALNQVVYLGVRSGLDMVCIGRYESDSQIQVGKGRVGLRMPFGMSPSCMAMLGKLTPDEVAEIIQVNLSRYHRVTGFDETGFRHAVEEAMKNGYSTYEGIVIDKARSGLGVATCDPEGFPVAGIGTTYITGWLNDKQWEYCLAQLQEAAETIAEDIFYRPGLSII